MARFSSYCPHCETTVSTPTRLAGDELKAALDSKADVEVMHVSDTGDHLWNLIADEKEILHKRIVDGIIPA